MKITKKILKILKNAPIYFTKHTKTTQSGNTAAESEGGRGG
jgi:hypothetical protein